MFDFIKNIFEGVKNFVVDNIINPVKDLVTSISKGHIFTGIVDFCVDTGIGMFVSCGLMFAAMAAYSWACAVITAGVAALVVFVLGYLVVYAFTFLFCYALAQFIAKRLGLVAPLNLAARAEYRKNMTAIAA